MFMVLSAEFLKLRRSKMLWLATIASLLPALVKYVQYASENGKDAAGWEWFLASSQEIFVFGMIITVVLVSSFIFSMEYQYNTLSYAFTSNVSRVKIFIAKTISILAILTFLVLVSALSQLLFGLLAIRTGLPGNLFVKFIKVTGWYIFSYFMVSAMVVMLTVFFKGFVLSAVVTMGYLMLAFPFHLKFNPYILPLMTPTMVAAKLYGSTDYIFTSYYQDIAVNAIAEAVFLAALAAVSVTIGIIRYKKLVR